MNYKEKQPVPSKPYVVALTICTCLSMGPATLAQANKVDPEAYYRAPSGLQGKTILLPIGTTFEGRLDSTVSSSHSRQGQRFTISMSSPVLANGSDVIIPSGSLIMGEVVEAIPSSHLPHQKNYPKPTGKLRVQLSGLRTPDGVMFPMVASLVGEVIKQGSRSTNQKGLGGGIGYVGSQASFDAVAPGMADKMRNARNGAPKVLTRQDLMRDAIMGIDPSDPTRQGGTPASVRSLVKRDHDLFIYEGSPVSIRIDAPFKIGVATAPTAGASYSTDFIDTEQRGGGRRFAPAGSPPTDQQRQQAQLNEGPLPQAEQSPLPFLPPKGTPAQTIFPVAGQQQAPGQQSVPEQQQQAPVQQSVPVQPMQAAPEQSLPPQQQGLPAQQQGISQPGQAPPATPAQHGPNDF